MASTIPTSILVISDNHADDMSIAVAADVAIHCGDLTEESKLVEYEKSLALLMNVKASLKLVIAGNHDFSMDDRIFARKIAEAQQSVEDDLVIREYGSVGAARALFRTTEAEEAGIVFLDEGTHKFELANGALLTVFASPCTPGISEWGFQYSLQQGHEWNIGPGVDIAITHGPPHGILDYAESKRAGCPQLFQAIASSRPLMHCFGHIHEAWGAKKVAWRSGEDSPVSQGIISHFAAIDNDNSEVIETLARIEPRKFDSEDTRLEKASKVAQYRKQGCCRWNGVLERGAETLFVNAAIEGQDEDSQHVPWLVKLDLPKGDNPAQSQTRDVSTKKRRLSIDEDAADGAGPVGQRRRTESGE